MQLYYIQKQTLNYRYILFSANFCWRLLHGNKKTICNNKANISVTYISQKQSFATQLVNPSSIPHIKKKTTNPRATPGTIVSESRVLTHHTQRDPQRRAFSFALKVKIPSERALYTDAPRWLFALDRQANSLSPVSVGVNSRALPLGTRRRVYTAERRDICGLALPRILTLATRNATYRYKRLLTYASGLLACALMQAFF